MLAASMISGSVVLLLIGMLGGIAMGMTQNFTLAPAHAHLNLLGGVLLFLMGLYYRLVPAAAGKRIAKAQGVLQGIGAILLPAGICLVLIHGRSYEAFPVIGGIITTVAVLLFLIITIQTAHDLPGSATAASQP